MPPADNLSPPSSRLPDRTRLGPVRLQVTDLPRSLAYYEQVIGLTPLSVDSSSAIVGLSSGSVSLLALHERRDARPLVRHSRLGLYHVAILLPDRQSLGSFLAHLNELDIPVASADHAVSEAVYLWDPDGLGLEVYADLPRSEWQQRNGEIYMTTAPLDLPALVSAAAGRPWRGLPANTTIGHLHLHVGSVAEAGRLYHQALGLDPTVSSYPGALFMSAGGYHHHLGVNTWAGEAPPSTERDARLLEWSIVLPDLPAVEQAAQRVEQAGYPVKRDGDRWRVSDPWGTVLLVGS